jgi:hypothetical protein
MEQSGSFNRRNRRHKKQHEYAKGADSGKKAKNHENAGQPAKPRINKEISENIQHAMNETNNAIREFRQIKTVCPCCGKTIDIIAEALRDKESGEPIHFDCALEKLREQEKISPTERIAYIGKGRFAVMFFPNRHDDANFTIRKIIEWENNSENETAPWRSEISGLFSQVK